MTSIPEAGKHCLTEALGRQERAWTMLLPPPNQGPHNAQIGNSVDPEWRDNAQRGDHRAPKRWTHGTRDVHAHAVGGDCSGEILLRNELWHDRLPRRRCQCPSSVQQERKEEQIDRRRQTNPNHRRIGRR